MPDYGDILRFLADHPPVLSAERQLHASLLELLAHCLRAESSAEEVRRTYPEGFAPHRSIIN